MPRLKSPTTGVVVNVSDEKAARLGTGWVSLDTLPAPAVVAEPVATPAPVVASEPEPVSVSKKRSPFKRND